ncbi:transcriptional regulator BsdA [Helicobacter pylori]
MELRHLYYFLTIAEAGSITKGAEMLNISQPPLSRQLKDLEDELGFNLFERNKKKKVRLTTQGEFFIEKAKAILNSVGDAVAEAKEFDAQVNCNLAIGTTIYSSQTMFKQIESFQQKNENIRYNIWEANSSSIIQLLNERKIDVGYINEPLTDSNIETKTIVSDYCVCILPHNIFRQYSKSEVSIVDLSQLPLILLTSTTYSGLYKQIMDTFNEHELEANILCECHDSSMLIQLLSRGFGGTILPASFITDTLAKDYAILPIIDNPWMPETKIAWRKEGYTAKIATKFIEDILKI